MDEKQEIITLIDEEGLEFEFTIVDYFWVDELEYAVLLPLPTELSTLEETENISYLADHTGEEGQENDTDNAVILRVLKGNNGETTLQVIEDEDEWKRIAEVAIERFYDEEME